jgi:hypothetical protein
MARLIKISQWEVTTEARSGGRCYGGPSVGGLNPPDLNELINEEIDKYARFKPRNLGWKGAKKELISVAPFRKI